MELDKEKLLANIKQALNDNAVNNALKTGNKEKILNSLPNETKRSVNELLNDNEKLKQSITITWEDS